MAEVLPRKELYEAWEVARRTRRRCRGGRVVDVAGGHGLLAHLMLLLDDTSAGRAGGRSRAASIGAIPSGRPCSCRRGRGWRAACATRRDRSPTSPCTAADVVVSSHACGALTDQVLEAAAVDAGARVAVLPCCHDADRPATPGPSSGWMDLALAVDTLRAVRLEARGYRVWTQTIPAAVTPKNRLLLGVPAGRFAGRRAEESGAE